MFCRMRRCFLGEAEKPCGFFFSSLGVPLFSPWESRNFTVVKVEISPWCCGNFTMVTFPLHHGGVLTAPWWSFYGTMVECHRHRGVFPDFSMVEFFLHHGVFPQKCGSSKSPWWRPFEHRCGVLAAPRQKLVPSKRLALLYP